GLHFASLDVRQESSVHNQVLEGIASLGLSLPQRYASLSVEEKVEALTHIAVPLPEEITADDITVDTVATVRAIRNIQQFNGEAGCNRYIISQCNSALNVLEVYGLFLLGGWEKDKLTIDIVPLFETVDDLQKAASIMDSLYSNNEYANHLGRRNKK